MRKIEKSILKKEVIKVVLYALFALFLGGFSIAYLYGGEYSKAGCLSLGTLSWCILLVGSIRKITTAKKWMKITSSIPVDTSNAEGIMAPSKEEDRNYYEKKEVKEMLCKAIDNIPDCAKITDCYTEHSFMASEAYIKVCVEVQDKTDENIIDFHNMAHDAFESGMDFIS